MSRRARLFSAPIAAALLVSACATPESRIKDDPRAFAVATAEQQALIRKGEIAVGFKPEFVKLALGEPDRITEHTDASGVETTWHYTESNPGYVARTGYYDPYFGPVYPAPFAAPLLGPLTTVAPSIESDRLRVVFRGGAVSAIERVVK